MTERNDRDIWRMVEGNPSIAYKDEIIAYDILAEEKRRLQARTLWERLRDLFSYHRYMWRYRREAWRQYRVAMQANKRNAIRKWLWL